MKHLIWNYFIISIFSSCILHPVTVLAAPVVEPAYDIIIDVGHGGIDGGTSSKEILEKDINLNVGVKLFQALRGKDFNVGITRIHDYALSDDSPFQHIRSRHKKDLEQRKLIADTLRPKLFISLHVNWAKNKNIRGPVVIYQPNEASYHLAHIVQSHLNKYYDLHKSPQKGKPYFLMKHLHMPSIIVELGYLSNAQDVVILTEEYTQDHLVNRLVYAIEEYFMLYPNQVDKK